MVKRIREYFKLRKLYKDSKKILVINAASAITEIKEIVDTVNDYIKSQKETIGSLTKEDFKKIVQYMENMNSPETQETMIKDIIKNIGANK